MNKLFSLFITVVAIQQAACAQTIKLSGKVTDRQGICIELATVTVTDSVDKVIAGCISDSAGLFAMEVMPQEKLTVNISHIGYNRYSRQIKDITRSAFIEAVMDTATTNLHEVVATSRTPIIRRKIDRVIFNTQKLNAIASSFMDVLKHTPGVIVQDDVISMIGKGKIVCLIDGRELMMDMKSLIVYLNSLPADNLKQIEVMTIPPAKYSAEGNAGVINFVTKKLSSNYLGGYVTNRLSIKERAYNGTSFSLQYKHNRLEAHINAGTGFGKIQTNSNKYIYYPSETWNTTNKRLKSNDYVLITAGVDYALTEKSSIGAIISYTDMQPDADNETETSVIAANTDRKLKYFETLTNFRSDYNRYNSNLHYTLSNIGNGGLLNVNADYLHYSIKDHVNLQTTHDEDLSYLNHPKTTIDVAQAKADMEMPAGNATISYGASCSQSKTDNRTDYERISAGYDLNDHFVYRELILAVYADVRYKFSDKLDAKLGVRGEYGRLDGNSVKLDNREIKRQLDLFPTAYLNYELNDNNSLYASVSSRINRPSYVDINPFTTYIDAHTIQSGNPKLIPEKSYTAELGYTFNNLSISASAMIKNRVIGSYVSVDNVNRLTTITVNNVMKKQMYSLDMSYYFDKVSWYDNSIDCSIYTIASKPMPGYQLEKVNHTSIFVYINNNFYFNKQKTLMANLWGQYQTKEKDVAGESPSRYRIDAGLKCLLFNKRLAIGIDCQNMLASHTKSIVSSNNATYVYDSKPYHVLNLAISYKFGKKLNIKQKEFGINTNRL